MQDIKKHGRKWFTPFWEACLARVRYNSLPALLRVNKDGWLDPESRRLVASRVIAHQLKEFEIKDVVEDVIDPELVPKKVDPVQMLDVVADAIQSEENNVISRTFRKVGQAWESYGTPALLVAGCDSMPLYIMNCYKSYRVTDVHGMNR